MEATEGFIRHMEGICEAMRIELGQREIVLEIQESDPKYGWRVVKVVVSVP